MIRITFPFNGAVLNHRHGRQTDTSLTITVTGIAPNCATVKVNGILATREGEFFHADIPLTKFDTKITATASGVQGEAEHTVRVVWDKYSKPRYRFSIDDNCFFLRDLFHQKHKSIFDSLYLSQLKALHDEFGVKFTLNLFYETPEREFNLSMMPDTWKRQFQDNADWLRMTWHAHCEFPDRPYQFASFDQVERDFDMIHDQICRFAGEESWVVPTIVHWGELHPSVFGKLHAKGVNALSGYFVRDQQRYIVSYGLDEARCAYMEQHDAIMDWSSGITFTRTDIVINCTPIEKVVPILEKQLANPDTAEYVDFLTHEQYFWPQYFNFVPDHKKRIETGLRYLTERGYEPIWMQEGFLGVPKAD